MRTKEGSLPVLHPLVDLCNAVSAAFAIPIAAFDASRIEGGFVVRPARGDERYDSFGGAASAAVDAFAGLLLDIVTTPDRTAGA